MSSSKLIAQAGGLGCAPAHPSRAQGCCGLTLPYILHLLCGFALTCLLELLQLADNSTSRGVGIAHAVARPALVLVLYYAYASGFQSSTKEALAYVRRQDMHAGACVGSQLCTVGCGAPCMDRAGRRRERGAEAVVRLTVGAHSAGWAEAVDRQFGWVGGVEHLHFGRGLPLSRTGHAWGSGSDTSYWHALYKEASSREPGQILALTPANDGWWLREPEAIASLFRSAARQEGAKILVPDVTATRRAVLGTYSISGMALVGEAGAVVQLLRAVPCFLNASSVSLSPSPSCLEQAVELSARDAALPRVARDGGHKLFYVAAGADSWPFWPWSLHYSPAQRLWLDASGHAPGIVLSGGGASARSLTIWDTVQGRNNAHCGPLHCFPLYAALATSAGLVMGVCTGVLVGGDWGAESVEGEQEEEGSEKEEGTAGGQVERGRGTQASVQQGPVTALATASLDYPRARRRGSRGPGTARKKRE